MTKISDVIYILNLVNLALLHHQVDVSSVHPPLSLQDHNAEATRLEMLVRRIGSPGERREAMATLFPKIGQSL